MTLIACAECGQQIDNRAATCPHCGHRRWGGYEYCSETAFLGLPLVHIATGIDPITGRQRVAKGIIAIGNLAVGVLAIGGVALGGVAFGGVACGLVALGGVGLGLLLAIGGAAVGGLALGGAAIGLVAAGGAALGYYALGGAAGGVHPLGATGQDPEAVEFFRSWLGEWVRQLHRGG
jgi:hypothetical protein